mmetsp:Transcript_13350/g.19489  ORF Transcript_13350/g.19489 Transcript_13350/m.19489 type:complete len:416 (+) Transcript_13350:19-1266(+)
MELTSHQLAALNAKLPQKFKIDSATKKDTRQTTAPKRRSEAENLDFDVQFHSRLPEKRPTREKRPAVYEETEPKLHQGDAYKKIYKILQTVKKHPMAELFLQPVDPSQVPDYYEVIEEPMDLSIVEDKLKNGEYDTAFQFAMDMRKIWSNSFYYNAKGSDLYHMTMELSSLFEKLMKGNESLILSDKKDVVQDLYRKLEKLSKGFKEMQNKTPATANRVQVKPAEKPMTIQEKKQLCQNIKKLEPRFLRGVLDIVQESMDVQGEELEFDVDKLPAKTCRELEKYVKQCLQTASRSKKKKPQTAINIEGIKAATEASSNRLKELDTQLEQLAQQTRNEPQEQQEESESSSSSSEEEEDVPGPQDSTNNAGNSESGPSVSSMWNSFLQQNMQLDTDQEFTTGFGSMMDLDKNQEMFR